MTERIAVGDFYCPIPTALNRHADTGDQYAFEWARRVGLMADEDTYGVEAARLGYLAGYAHPSVSWEGLKIAIEWLDWLMVYDDAMFDKRANVTKLDRIRILQFHRDVLDILRGAPVPDGAPPLYRGMGELRRSIVEFSPTWDMSRFVDNFARYLQSNLWEATNIWRGQPPAPSTYTAMRRHTGCLFPTYELSAVLGRIRLTPEVGQHVALHQLEIMANNYTCWLNDVYSFERERDDGQVNNLVAVLQHEYRCGFQEAADRAVEMCRVEMKSYLELKDRLPDLGIEVDDTLREYLTVLEAWMRALYDWHHLTGRYLVSLAHPRARQA
ncbi:MAG TPA: hypothetical protein VE776_00730 [Actinomycetota bacterium]|jgi:5-epi-alpha-selinene synthase|nr:hypothetical protein [Actinomycetota bacterium]